MRKSVYDSGRPRVRCETPYLNNPPRPYRSGDGILIRDDKRTALSNRREIRVAIGDT